MKVLSTQETNQVVGGFFFFKLLSCVVRKFCGYSRPTQNQPQNPAVKPPVTTQPSRPR